jgi:hypothetical protein
MLAKLALNNFCTALTIITGVVQAVMNARLLIMFQVQVLCDNFNGSEHDKFLTIIIIFRYLPF